MKRETTGGFGSAALKARVWFPAVFALAGALTGAALFAMAPRTYRASTTILAVRDPVLSPADTDPDQRLQRIAGTVLLDHKVVPIISRFGLYQRTPSWEGSVAEMWKHITLDASASGPAPRYELRLALTFESTDRRTAVAVTERLAALFLEANPEPPSPPDPIDVALGQQLDIARERLRNMEARLNAWRLKNPGRRLPTRLEEEHQRVQDEYTGLLRRLDERHLQPNIERRALGELFSIADTPHVVSVDAPDAMPFVKRGATVGVAYGSFLWFVAFLWDRRSSAA